MKKFLNENFDDEGKCMNMQKFFLMFLQFQIVLALVVVLIWCGVAFTTLTIPPIGIMLWSAWARSALYITEIIIIIATLGMIWDKE